MTQSVSGFDVPPWFTRAVTAEPQRHVLEAFGVGIHYRTWGEPVHSGLVLVHGAGAHSGWWDHIAPLVRSRRVVALDLSGHGDSGHRRTYDMALWAREILAVIAAERLHRPVVVGHSMGGRAAVTAAVEHPGSLAAIVCVDTPLTRHRTGDLDRRNAARPPSVYPTVQEAIFRFRTRPPLEALPAHVRDHVARESLRAVEGGWTWKGDEGVFGQGQRMQDLLPRVACPMALLRGEHGLIPPEMAGEMAALTTSPIPVIELADTGHHPMLDRPLILATALRTLLAVWPDGTAAGTDS
ncbi:MAG: alpha/beta hydrolase [Mycobacteriales bacterium]